MNAFLVEEYFQNHQNRAKSVTLETRNLLTPMNRSPLRYLLPPSPTPFPPYQTYTDKTNLKVKGGEITFSVTKSISSENVPPRNVCALTLLETINRRFYVVNAILRSDTSRMGFCGGCS